MWLNLSRFVHTLQQYSMLHCYLYLSALSSATNVFTNNLKGLLPYRDYSKESGNSSKWNDIITRTYDRHTILRHNEHDALLCLFYDYDTRMWTMQYRNPLANRVWPVKRVPVSQ